MSSTATNSVSSLVQSIGEIPPEAIVFGASDPMQALRDVSPRWLPPTFRCLSTGKAGRAKTLLPA